MAKLINALDPIANKSHTITWTLLRVLSSLMLMTHGYAKLFGATPQSFLYSAGGADFFGINLGVNMLWVAAIIEFFGGALLVLGLFTRPLALLVAILMVMAYLTAHMAWFPTLNNGELAAMYFVVYLALFSQGAGRISLDAMLFNKR